MRTKAIKPHRHVLPTLMKNADPITFVMASLSAALKRRYPTPRIPVPVSSRVRLNLAARPVGFAVGRATVDVRRTRAALRLTRRLVTRVGGFVARFTTATRITGRSAIGSGIAEFAAVAESAVVRAIGIVGRVHARTAHTIIVGAADTVVAVGGDAADHGAVNRAVAFIFSALARAVTAARADRRHIRT